MEKIKQGYKQTDIGVIPKDWEVTNMDSVMDLLTDYDANGSFESVAVNVRVFNFENFAWYVRATDLEKTPTQIEKFVDEESYKFLKKTSLYGGEILLAKRGEIGKVYMFEMKTMYATLAPNLYLLKLNNRVFSHFLYYFLKSYIGQSFLKKINAATSLGALYKDDVKALQMPLPSFKEQKAIAIALSDIDLLIDELTKLLDKKRAIKEGAMQQLLSPKEGWKNKLLGELCELIVDGTHQTPTYVDSGIPFYSVENVTNNNFTKTKYISLEEHLLLIKRCKITKGDILLTRIGSVGKTKLVDWDANASIYVSLALLRVNQQKINKLFLYTYTKTEQFIKDIEALSLMNAIPLKINMDNIKKIPINYPSSIEEQQQIASILSDMDNEIEALEQNLLKYKAIKIGMMQKLLTGQIRLL